ncbi:MAG: hypothetical protein ACREYE_26680 [Gammaproteobacteria bacterium]
MITLGRLATRVFEASGSRIPSVVGALDISPETRPDACGISLAVDPGAMYDRLKRMAPGVKRVFFAYEPGHDGWLLEHAKKEAAPVDWSCTQSQRMVCSRAPNATGISRR